MSAHPAAAASHGHGSASSSSSSGWLKVAALFVGAAAVLLFFTNPDLAHYKTWTAAQRTGIVQNIYESLACEQRQTGNYFLASRYENACGAWKQQCTGVLNTFYCNDGKEEAAPAAA